MALPGIFGLVVQMTPRAYAASSGVLGMFSSLEVKVLYPT